MLIFQRHLTRPSLKQLRCFTSSNLLSSKEDKTDSAHEKKIEKKEDKRERKLSKEEATTKLNNLLQMMVQKEEEHPVKEIKVAQAVKLKQEKPVKEKPLGTKLADAAKDVATSLGRDVEKTESELLNILLKSSESSTHILKDVLAGMKVEKTPAESVSRAQQVRDTLAKQPTTMSVSGQMRKERGRVQKTTAVQVDILGAQPSSYFSGLKPTPASCELTTWEACIQRDLRLASTHPPANIYEQMIQWTDRNMLWHFPIDNEQGLEDEKQVSFEDHIFLETHLEGWCPEKGPIRHFMELVCVGLSKNHWLSAEEKRNHIFWYRDYFADKQTLLKEIGAGNIAIEPEVQKETTQ